MAACPGHKVWDIQEEWTILHMFLNIKKKYTIDTGGLLKTYI